MSSVDLFANYRDNSFEYDNFNYEENKGYMFNLKDEWSDYEENKGYMFNLKDEWSDYEDDSDDCDYLVNVTKKLRLDPSIDDVD